MIMKPNPFIRLAAILLAAGLATDPAVTSIVGAGHCPRPQRDINEIFIEISGRRGGLPLQFLFTSQALQSRGVSFLSGLWNRLTRSRTPNYQNPAFAPPRRPRRTLRSEKAKRAQLRRLYESVREPSIDPTKEVYAGQTRPAQRPGERLHAMLNAYLLVLGYEPQTNRITMAHLPRRGVHSSTNQREAVLTSAEPMSIEDYLGIKLAPFLTNGWHLALLSLPQYDEPEQEDVEERLNLAFIEKFLLDRGVPQRNIVTLRSVDPASDLMDVTLTPQGIAQIFSFRESSPGQIDKRPIAYFQLDLKKNRPWIWSRSSYRHLVSRIVLFAALLAPARPPWFMTHERSPGIRAHRASA